MSRPVRLPEDHWGIRTVGRYQKLEQIGEGTYGQVFKARNRQTGDIVALKKIIVHHERNGLPVTAIREIKALKSLEHPNMVKLLEIVTSKTAEDDKEDSSDSTDGFLARGNIYLVLEYMEHDLSGLIDMNYPFTPLIIKTIFKQLLEVLDHMHSNKFLHRDIKCSNLLLTPYHELRLADFGLTRSYADGRDREKELSNKVITLWYRPPELLLGETKYGPAVDLWSAGCILAELIVGRPLFPYKTEPEQLNGIFRVMGTPNQQNWPGYRSLPLYQSLGPRQDIENRFREYYYRKIPADALDLLERLLTLDPSRRLSARGALASKYFSTEPLPVNPRRLPPIDLESCHELKTKRLKKEQLASQEAMGGGAFQASSAREYG